MTSRIRLIAWLVCVAAPLAAAPRLLAQVSLDPPPATEPGSDLSPAAQRAIDASFLTESERRDKRIFHGVWADADLDTPTRRAMAALIAGDLLDPAFDDASVPALIRADRLVRIGETDAAIALLVGDDSPAACRLRGEALEWNGDFEKADEAIEPVIAALSANRLESAADLTEAARCLAMRARLRGEPGSQYHAILAITSQVHQRIDRLYWPAKLVEAQLLADKDNPKDALAAAAEVLSLNPRCCDAWMILARINLDGYNFDGVESIIAQLEQLVADHIQSRLLQSRLELVQGMAEEAEHRLDALLDRMPRHREALALRAVVEAVRYDEDGLYLALRDFETISGRNPWAWYTAGAFLSANRQYDFAAQILNGAIERQPNWPAPQIELGLMYLQSGNDAEALSLLRKACALDPFNVRAAFSLHLIESLQKYDTVSSEHFVIRFDPESADRALAAEMLGPLEAMNREITTALEHQPDRPTRIELMPNHSRFAVRITGMPDIHTIAACTGPIIAMEAPREGPDHFGTYNWLRVLRHEYVHTVTLSQTRNRIPHWFTEGIAVWLEDGPREYNTCSMLAQACRDDDLFTLDEINWAFVRPKRPNDRSLAYAQSEWMVEFMVERFGHDAFLALLDQYAEGFREDLAIPAAFNLSRGQFYDQFTQWAGEQVRQWGMAPDPSLEEIVQENLPNDPDYRAQVAEFNKVLGRRIGETMARLDPMPGESPRDRLARLLAAIPRLTPPRPQVTSAAIDRWLTLYPEQPDLLRLKIERWRAARDPGPDMIDLLDRYALARPVDPMPQQLLAAIYLKSGEPERAIPYLEAIDRLQKYDNSYAEELARLYQKQGRYEVASARIDRAVLIAPYDARIREQAAAMAIQARQLDDARRHLVALSILEPNRAQHQRRLEALDQMMQNRQ